MAALQPFTSLENRIVHKTGVDFSSRPSIFSPVHVVQYDNKLPIIEVKMFQNGVPYKAPEGAFANIRLGKKNRKAVYNPALGCSEDRTTLYFEVSQQMVTDPGDFDPIVEIIVNDVLAGSSPIRFMVHRNPVQEDYIESSDEFNTVKDFADKAINAAEEAENSKDAAKESETKAAESESKALEYKNAAGESATNAAESAEAAAQSETDAESWSNWSKSYAIGEGDKRPDEKASNAKAYYEQILRLSQSFNGVVPMGTVTFEELANVETKLGYMYNISDEFTSDDRFNVPNQYYGPGNNVIWTAEEKWDVTAASTVTGIKGNAEDTYNQGNYEISPDNVKLPSTFEAAVKESKIEPNDTLSIAFSKLAKYCESIEALEKTPTIFGSYEEFERPGEAGRLYVDETVDPRLIYTWSEKVGEYVLTGGAGGEGSSMDIPLTLLSNGWTDIYPYSQKVIVGQMREDLTPIHFLADGADDAQQYAYSLLTDYETGLGEITFYASEKPTVNINLVLKGVPAQELDVPDNSVIVMVEEGGWELDDATQRYKKTVTVDGMKPGLGGHWDIVRSGGVITLEESEIALNITDVEREEGAITIYCIDRPTSGFTLILFGTYKEATEGDILISGLPGLVSDVAQNKSNISSLSGEVEKMRNSYDNTPITLTENSWLIGHAVHGGRFRVPIATNLSNVNITSPQMFISDNWRNVKLDSAFHVGGTLYLVINPNDASSEVQINAGYSYLFRCTGTIS